MFVNVPFEVQSRCLSRFLPRCNRGVCRDSFRGGIEMFVNVPFEMQSRCLSRFLPRCNRGVCRDSFRGGIEMFVEIPFETQSRCLSTSLPGCNRGVCQDSFRDAIEVFVKRSSVVSSTRKLGILSSLFLPIFALLRVAITVSLPTLHWY